jgi:hypothetical protein
MKMLFVLRAYNDIDHMTPLIDHLLSNKKDACEIKVFFAKHDTREFEGNENIEYLRQHHALDFHVFSPSWALPLFRALDVLEDRGVQLMRLLKGSNRYRVRAVSMVEGAYLKSLKLTKSRLLRRHIANEVLRYAPDIVCLDWVDLKLFPYKHIAPVARERGIPIVGLPHGLNVFAETMDAVRRRRDAPVPLPDTLRFDFQFAPNELNKQHIVDDGFPAERVLVLGAPRYDRKWLEQKEKHFSKLRIDRDAIPGAVPGPKIVVFPNKLMYRGNADAVKQIIEICMRYGPVIVKPHTRNMDISFIERTRLKEKCRIVGNETNSSDLIDWCDIAVFWGSSIGIQVIMENKKFIYARFAHNYPTIYDQYFPSSSVQDIDALENTLTDMARHPDQPQYGASEVEAFLRDIVYSSEQPCDISERYFNQIVMIALDAARRRGMS